MKQGGLVACLLRSGLACFDEQASLPQFFGGLCLVVTKETRASATFSSAPGSACLKALDRAWNGL